VFDANAPIIAELKQRGRMFRHDTYVHSYPHCWRTGEPLIYKAVSSWFVHVTAIKDRMVELNREIQWVPEHIQEGQFGKWLEGARDWSISRNRFWGAPIPIWKSDDPRYPRIDVYGSVAELERDFGRAPETLHRPHIDDLVRPNPDDPTGQSMMRRVPEVLDCWFESGSMFFAQLHYPFENKQWFESHFPADFITEYVGQTRGWFYTMMVLATALFDRPPLPADRPRGPRHSRGGAPGPEPDLERLLTVLPLRQRRGRARERAHRLGASARPLRPVQDARAHGVGAGAHGRLRHPGRLRPHLGLRRCPQQLVHPPQPRALLAAR
jgi:hypothetical protein